MASNNSSRTCLRVLRTRTTQTQIHSHNTELARFKQSKVIHHGQTSRQRFLTVSARFLNTPEVKPIYDTPAPVPSPPENAKEQILPEAPIASGIAAQLRKRAVSMTETYLAYGSTESLFKTCSRQADYDIPQVRENQPVPKSETGEELGVGEGWWYQELKLIPTFNTWAQITYLHMYIITVRFRLFPAAHAPIWHQHLVDHFFFTAEARMEALHGMTSATVRAKYLKDLYIQWRGVLTAYDEGIVKGDAMLAAAVWRNIFKGAEDVNAVDLAMVTSYLRREIARVGAMSEQDLVSGTLDFGNPGDEKNVVLMESHLMRQLED